MCKSLCRWILIKYSDVLHRTCIGIPTVCAATSLLHEVIGHKVIIQVFLNSHESLSVHNERDVGSVFLFTRCQENIGNTDL